jgi:hypothetical protein
MDGEGEIVGGAASKKPPRRVAETLGRIKTEAKKNRG